MSEAQISNQAFFVGQRCSCATNLNRMQNLHGEIFHPRMKFSTAQISIVNVTTIPSSVLVKKCW